MSDALSWLGFFLVALSVLWAVPVVVLLVQVLMAWPAERPGAPVAKLPGPRPRLAVVMPAHNESAGIAAALQSLRPQLQAGDRLLVVADNCSDDTAAVAAAAGAEVVERHDLSRRGKGYALDYGVRHLAADAPAIVVIVDADCEVAPGALDRLVRRCAETARPVQALYLMHAPAGAGLKQRIAEFAWSVKNHARPLGFLRLGGPCQLMGTGMAFPWSLIHEAPLASGHIVEDMQLGLDLAGQGAAPLFCPQAQVSSHFPSTAEGMASQRTRWEHRHLGVIASQAPRMMWRALTRGRPSLVAMVLDLCVPPLASLVLLLVAWVGLMGGFFVVSGGALPLQVAAATLALLGLAVMLAWWRFGRRSVSLGELLSAPAYVLGKLPMYAKLLRKRQVEWVRTRRGDGSQ
jgi:cellulose synthase/poly-beta-1,6-N-acetylglucosamine synthase-like glycosyltransferase